MLTADQMRKKQEEIKIITDKQITLLLDRITVALDKIANNYPSQTSCIIGDLANYSQTAIDVVIDKLANESNYTAKATFNESGTNPIHTITISW